MQLWMVSFTSTAASTVALSAYLFHMWPQVRHVMVPQGELGAGLGLDQATTGDMS